MRLARFNALPAQEAQRALLDCCTAPRWARELAAGRPYPNPEALFAAAATALTDTDVDDGLTGHPRIGDRAGGDARSGAEQGGVDGAPEAVLAALADGNQAYEQRFGRVYLVCATGRTAEELLAVLRERLRNAPDVERRVRRAELVAINRIRLAQLVEYDQP